MSHRKKAPPAPKAAAPQPAVITVEGFGRYETPDPGERFFNVPRWDTPSVGNGMASVYRYKTTVQRIEEPADVIVERLYVMWEAAGNWHDRETLEAEARKRFGVRLREMYEERRAKGAAS